MSDELIFSLYKSACQNLPASFASPQYTSRFKFEESQIAVVMLVMLGNYGQTRTSEHIFSYLAYLSSHDWMRQRRWVSVSMVCNCLRLAMMCCMLWTPIPIALSAVGQWFCLLPDCLYDCCQTLRPRVCCQNGRWRSHPSFACCRTIGLSVVRPLVSVARLSDGGANPLFVCCPLSNWLRKSRCIWVSMVCDCLRLAMVCCMLSTPIPIAVSTVWQWLCPTPMLKLGTGIWRARAMFELKEGAEGRQPFKVEGGVREPCWSCGQGVERREPYVKIHRRDLKDKSHVQVEGSWFGDESNVQVEGRGFSHENGMVCCMLWTK